MGPQKGSAWREGLHLTWQDSGRDNCCFFGFRVRPMETFLDRGTATGCDTDEWLLLGGLTKGGNGQLSGWMTAWTLSLRTPCGLR